MKVSTIYLNLPVKDLPKTIEFFTKLGFTFNPQFTDENAACMVISDTIYAMLIVHSRFKDFTKKEICNSHTHTEALFALEVESKNKVDELVKIAVENGAKIYMEPADHGWMYSHSFADLDGHQWELMWTDISRLPDSI